MITKTEVQNDFIRVTLDSGVTVDMAFHNPHYIHMSFSGIKDGITAGPFHNHPELNSAKLANYLDVSYIPTKEPR